ncbi:hypothetical protein XACM_3446 [Xanthomonas euvesicatoria pv. citrumelo F1]|nr:hypothetical protein XACM_3446 [Xanthomonas euvesicatoria pv. citrumelo F1]
MYGTYRSLDMGVMDCRPDYFNGLAVRSSRV